MKHFGKQSAFPLNSNQILNSAQRKPAYNENNNTEFIKELPLGYSDANSSANYQVEYQTNGDSPQGDKERKQRSKSNNIKGCYLSHIISYEEELKQNQRDFGPDNASCISKINNNKMRKLYLTNQCRYTSSSMNNLSDSSSIKRQEKVYVMTTNPHSKKSQMKQITLIDNSDSLHQGSNSLAISRKDNQFNLTTKALNTSNNPSRTKSPGDTLCSCNQSTQHNQCTDSIGDVSKTNYHSKSNKDHPYAKGQIIVKQSDDIAKLTQIKNEIEKMIQMKKNTSNSNLMSRTLSSFKPKRSMTSMKPSVYSSRSKSREREGKKKKTKERKHNVYRVGYIIDGDSEVDMNDPQEVNHSHIQHHKTNSCNLREMDIEPYLQKRCDCLPDEVEGNQHNITYNKSFNYLTNDRNRDISGEETRMMSQKERSLFDKEVKKNKRHFEPIVKEKEKGDNQIEEENFRSNDSIQDGEEREGSGISNSKFKNKRETNSKGAKCDIKENLNEDEELEEKEEHDIPTPISQESINYSKCKDSLNISSAYNFNNSSERKKNNSNPKAIPSGEDNTAIEKAQQLSIKSLIDQQTSSLTPIQAQLNFKLDQFLIQQKRDTVSPVATQTKAKPEPKKNRNDVEYSDKKDKQFLQSLFQLRSDLINMQQQTSTINIKQTHNYLNKANDATSINLLPLKATISDEFYEKVIKKDYLISEMKMQEDNDSFYSRPLMNKKESLHSQTKVKLSFPGFGPSNRKSRASNIFMKKLKRDFEFSSSSKQNVNSFVSLSSHLAKSQLKKV